MSVSPFTTIAVVNRSTVVTDPDVERMAMACARQLAEHVAPFWGSPPAVVFIPKGDSLTPDQFPASIEDDADEPGVEGYHTGDYLKVFAKTILGGGGSVLTGPNSVSGCLGHEFCETMVNPAANRWADGPKGLDYALETGDPVQPSRPEEAYEIDGVSVPNFVLPTYFDPESGPGVRLDYLDVLRSPFSIGAAGYLITRTEPGKITDLFGQHAQAIEAKPGIVVHVGRKVAPHKVRGLVWKASRRRLRGEIR